MKEIILNGKKRKLQSTFYQNRELLKKYDMKNPKKEWTVDEEEDFLIEAVWKFLKPKFGVKPFITFERFKRKADFEEIKKQIMVVLAIIHAVDLTEDRESKNPPVKKLQSVSG